MANDNDIAIVGMSCYFPGAANIHEYWNNLVNGVNSITEAPEHRIDHRFFTDNPKNVDVDRFYFRKGGFVSPLTVDPLEYGILPIAAEGIDPDQLVALYLVREALKDAGMYDKKTSLQKCCFILGKGNFSSSASIRVAEFMYLTTFMENFLHDVFPGMKEEEILRIKKEIQSKLGRYQADTAAGTMPNLVVSQVANKLDMKGPAYTIDAACASSLLAVDHAMNLLLSGQCDIALAGGMHLGQGPSFWSVFNVIGAVSHKGQIAPFGEDADGLLIGEGAGILVLKKLDKAIADNDRIYAVIKACAIGSDGSDVSIMAPSFKGQVETIRQTWAKTNMDPKNVGYVETHGTATQVGDRTEIATLTTFFGDKTAPPVLFGSVKSNIGHAMAAAGIAGLIKTVLSLYYKKIPPTLHCEKPLKAVLESRFRPAQELTEWDGVKYPFVAAVNAFGFGGINSHIILERYEAPQTAVTIPKSQLLKDKVISLSAETKEELLSKLENGDYTVSKGDYRLVIFNPTADRLDKAKTLIEKDNPWKGRLDIWFSNKPLLKDGGKVVCMFAGFDPGTEIEIQSVADYFELPYKQVPIGKDQLSGHSINHFYRSRLLDLALKKMGLKPDINIGHSLGEWHAAGAAGCVTPESIENLISLYNPEDYLIIDVIYIAVGCGKDRAKQWCDEIPDLYLANDNCPNQILMGGKKEAIDSLKERLQKEQIFYQVLPYHSGYHTPLFPDEILDSLHDVFLSTLVYKKREIPLWSSTILKEYPKEQDEFNALFIRNLRETVRFRELIDILYNQENARVFIQVGVGSLDSFVDDTLKEKKMSVIPTIHSHHSGIEQIRRIAALLFIEGKTINKELIDITETQKPKIRRSEIVLDFAQNTISNLPELKDIILHHILESYKDVPGISSFLSGDIEDELKNDPILQEANNNLREIVALQTSMLEWYKTTVGQRIIQKMQDGSLPSLAVENHQHKAGDIVEKDLRFDLDNHPYLLDHIVVRQPKNRPQEELNPVVPFAMTIETLCELAQELNPSKKVLRVSEAGVQKWIPVREPFIAKITGQWKTDDCISWSLPGHAFGDITLGDAYPAVPEEYLKDIEFGDNIFPEVPKREEIYSRIMFHGPKYQSIIEIGKFTKIGLTARVRKMEGKGSVLDNLGQLLGLYCYTVFEKNLTTFPRGVDEMIFYQDFNDQKGIFDFILTIKDVKDYEIVSNVIIKRDGKIWCVVKGWHNLRLDYSRESMNVIMQPTKTILSKKIDENVYYYYYDTQMRASSYDFMHERYLNAEERKHFHSLYPNQGRNYLISRVALKDCVRKYLQKDENENLIYPIEIAVGHDENGKPYIYGHEKLKGIEVSLAHKGSEAVAIASDKPAGIDIEKIESRTKDFMEMTFTSHELDLLKEKENEAEWTIRFWVAKEAYGKKLGLGLQGKPKQYEIKSIDGNELKINDTWIKTVEHRDNFIVGWTL